MQGKLEYSGYSVVGWTKYDGANPQTIWSLDLPDDTAYTPGSIIYFVAKKASTTYTLRYDANGGTGAPASQSASNTSGKATFAVSNTVPTRDGYTFKGWADSADATTAAYQAGDSITVNNPTSKTIYAVWEQTATPKTTYTITYNDGADGKAFASQTYSVEKGETTPGFNGTPTREGYTFKGWNPEVAATVTADAVYTAVWEKQGETKPDEPGTLPDDLVINKTLTMAADGVAIPDVTFKFNVAAVTEGAPEVGEISIKASEAMKNAKAATEAIFKNVDFSSVAPGNYEYSVTEVNDAVKDITYDSSEYKLVVQVVYDETANTNKISGIEVYKKTGEKDGQKTYGDKLSAIDFTNKYTKYSNPDNNDKGLEVSKAVKGTGASKNDEFTFSVIFTKDEANDGMTLTASKDLQNGETIVKAGEALSYDTTYTFKLRADESIDFKLPAGTKYTVTETDAKGYEKTTYVATVNGQEQEAAEGRTYTQTAGENANAVAFTNEKENNPLTGIVNNYGAMIAVIAIAAGGFVILSIRRKKSED